MSADRCSIVFGGVWLICEMKRFLSSFQLFAVDDLTDCVGCVVFVCSQELHS